MGKKGRGLGSGKKLKKSCAHDESKRIQQVEYTTLLVAFSSEARRPPGWRAVEWVRKEKD